MKKIMFLVIVVLLNSILFAGDWTVVQTPEVSKKWALFALSFPDSDNGWAVGYDYSEVGFAKGTTRGIILNYNSAEWVVSEVPQVSNSWSLNDLYFISTTDGWAVGRDNENSKGVILHFIDGAWNVIDPPQVPYSWWQLYGVKFLDENEGWAIGGAKKDGAVLLHYKDGKWTDETDLELLEGHTLLTVFPLDAENVWTAGYKEGLLASISMGSHARGTFEIHLLDDTWDKVKQPLLEKNVICEDYYFFGPKDGWKVGWMPAFKSSPDTGKMLHWNGKKWKKEKLDGPKGWTLRAIDFSDAKTGWAVGMNTKKEIGLFFEYKKGKWSQLKKKKVPKIDGDWEVRDIQYDGSGNWWAVGCNYSDDYGIILKYTP